MKTIDEIEDNEYHESKIEKVDKCTDGYEITRDDGWSQWIDDVGIVPKVGDTIRTYGKGIGFTVRGVAINGKVVRYKTRKQEQADFKREIEESERKEKEKFKHNKELLDYRYSKLPEVFRKRLDSFRKNNPNFRWKYEAYEMFCCEQAIDIAKNLKTEEAISNFRKLSFEEQKKLVPTISDGHSGNTFSFACFMASLYIRDESFVEKMHGALCPLVGCESYGCWSAYQGKEDKTE